MKPVNKNLLLRYFLWAAVFAVMIVIFVSSSKTAEESSQSSSTVAKTILSLVVGGFSDYTDQEQQIAVDSIQFLVRKTAHFAVYLTLGFLCLFAMNTYSIRTKPKVLISLLISFIYAVSDEIHQIFVPGRSGQISDIILDFSGSLTGVALALLAIAIFRKIKVKKVRYAT